MASERSGLLSPELLRQLEEVRTLLGKALAVARDAKSQAEVDLLESRLGAIEKAALVVIVGEVKAGKSTFINALLGDAVCEVAPDPCTATIQELTWGEERRVETLGPSHERLFLPHDVLKEITIVDTPGTNSVIEQHQVITESYVPQSDLVLFVLPARNPHTKSAWDFLDLINAQFRQKVCFVLQQADLATENELEISTGKTRDYARTHGITSPDIFAVSAKREIDGEQGSGFGAFRSHLNDVIRNGSIWQGKLDASRGAAASAVTRIREASRERMAAIDKDLAFYENIASRIDRRRLLISDRGTQLRGRVLVAYDQSISGLRNEIEQGLAFWSVVKRTLTFHAWVQDLEDSFQMKQVPLIRKSIQDAAEDYAAELNALVDDVLDEIDRRIQQRSSATAADLRRLRERIEDIELPSTLGAAAEGISPGGLAIGGAGLAALGTLIATITTAMVFDITGGILALIGGTMIAIGVYFRRGSILQKIDRAAAKGREDLDVRFGELLGDVESKVVLGLMLAMDDEKGTLAEDRKRLEAVMEAASGVLASS
jgi:small GTP-binding protein